MKRATQEEYEHIVRAVRHNPKLREWLERCRDEELQALPLATHNTAQAQGRCQVLNELVTLFEKASEV